MLIIAPFWLKLKHKTKPSKGDFYTSDKLLLLNKAEFKAKGKTII